VGSNTALGAYVDTFCLVSALKTLGHRWSHRTLAAVGGDELNGLQDWA